MATPIALNTPLFQVTGGQTFQLNPETTLAQVKCADGIDAETRLGTLERAVSGKATLRIADDIAGRDSLLGLIAGDQVWVIDATADATVASGGAKYLYMLDNTWLKIGEAESMDIVFNWALLQDKPTSTVEQIDLAVAKQHVHDNIETLTHVSDDGAGNLLFKGRRVSDGKVWVAAVASLDDIPANLADGGLVFVNPALASGGTGGAGEEVTEP